MTGKEILRRAGETVKIEPAAKSFAINYFDLVERATDPVIEEALGENHIFDKGDVYILIGNLIAKQPNGEEGTLINNGFSNLFYTPSFVVRVYWLGSLWCVYAWDRDGCEWHGGHRVFSPATEA